jgi:flagellin-specific chaperone FliS
MNALLTVSKVSIIVMLIVGFFKFLILDKILLDWQYYLTANEIIWRTIVILTISTFGSLVIWLVGILINKPKK